MEGLNTDAVGLKARNWKEMYDLLSGPNGIYLPKYSDCNYKFLQELL